MSGPKGGSYVVVSAQELERRALRAAQDRYSRVRADFLAVAESLKTYEETVITPPALAKGDSTAVTTATAQLEGQLARAREVLSDRRVAAAIALTPKIRLSIDFGALAKKAAETATTSAGSARAPVSEVAADPAAAAEQLVFRALKELGSDHVATLSRKLAGIQSADSPTQARMGLDDLRFTVQKLREARRESLRQAQAREDVLAALDGCASAEAKLAREQVLGTPAGSPVPVALEYAQGLAERERAAADAIYVEDAVIDVLAELGYQVDGPMSVSVAGEGALLRLPGHDRHLARLRSRNGQLQFNVVRVGEAGAAGTAGDVSAEVAACEVFADLHDGLAQLGVQWELSRQDAPGETPLPFMAKEPPTVVKPVTTQKARSSESAVAGRRRRARERGRELR